MKPNDRNASGASERAADFGGSIGSRFLPPPSTLHPPPLRGRRGGFTLLELMVVIFIMLLMATLAVASFRSFLDTERIKLAGGTIHSAINMAREYAMSKRTKCLVEFIEPSDTEHKSTTLGSAQITYVRGGTHVDEVQTPGSMTVRLSSVADSKYNGLMRFDLSVLDTPGSLVIVKKATLKLAVQSAGSGAPGNPFAVKGVASDTWDQTTVTWNTQPAAGVKIDAFTVTSTAAKVYSVDVSTYVSGEHAGDQLASLGVYGEASSGVVSISGVTTTLEVEYDVITAMSAEETALYPRQIRIVPYRRMTNPDTGGIVWLLDQDDNALKSMELPKNVVYALTPPILSVQQYDPVDGSVPVLKRFLVLSPDGSCAGEAPVVEDDPFGNKDHWKTYVNTVIIRDTSNDDMCLLYVPPATSFTRQRYLFGGPEVVGFLAAHEPYVLW